MKTIHVEKNRVFVYYEMKDLSLKEIFAKQPNLELRFDLKYVDDDEDLESWRGVVKKGEDGESVLEIKNYENTEHETYTLEPYSTLSDASTVALRQIWVWIEERKNEFPPTQALPIIDANQLS